MSDKKQPEIEQPGWLCKACLWLARIFLGLLVIAISYCICSPYLYPEQRTVNNDHTRLGWYLIGLAVICGLVLRWPKITTSSPKKYFIARVLAAGVTGGVFAFLLPVAVKSTTTGVGGLRHSILLATGGFIAILTLGETRRKNDIDKKKNKQEKKKNDKDHQRQVRAERRERYTKAVEQLGSKEAPVRMGGVYTLVGLVDEWLEDESIEEYEDRLMEGQVIINNLCAYIRSPFTLASQYGVLSRSELNSKNKLRKFIRKYIQRDFYINKANLQAEADVRLSIIKEIHDRMQGKEENTPGTWSDFEYNFSGSTFFYPVDLTKSYYKKPVTFSESTYQGWAVFRGSTYKEGADFRGSIYEDRADFSDSTYRGRADFSDSTYKWADFRSSIYQEEAYLIGSIYQEGAYFSGSTYQEGAYFNSSTYKWADFCNSVYQKEANFSGSTYQSADFSNSIYQSADFSGSIYQERVDFGGSTYKWSYFSDSTYKWADFCNSIYQEGAYFSGSTYENRTDFSGSIFYQETYFDKDGSNNSSSCFTNCTPQFYDKKNRKNTLFGSHNNDFTVDTNKGYPIDLDSEGIPLNCKHLTLEQEDYLAYKFQEIEKINNEILEAKDPKKNAKILYKLHSLNKELHEWREEATTVKMEDVAVEDMES